MSPCWFRKDRAPEALELKMVASSFLAAVLYLSSVLVCDTRLWLTRLVKCGLVGVMILLLAERFSTIFAIVVVTEMVLLSASSLSFCDSMALSTV